jgi:hypothetical protein
MERKISSIDKANLFDHKNKIRMLNNSIRDIQLQDLNTSDKRIAKYTGKKAYHQSEIDKITGKS